MSDYDTNFELTNFITCSNCCSLDKFELSISTASFALKSGESSLWNQDGLLS